MFMIYKIELFSTTRIFKELCLFFYEIKYLSYFKKLILLEVSTYLGNITYMSTNLEIII